jgi:hypothetical protein
MFEICNIPQHLLLYGDSFYLQARSHNLSAFKGYLISSFTATLYIWAHNILQQAWECALSRWQIDKGETNKQNT